MSMGDLVSPPHRAASCTDEAIKFLKALDPTGRHNLWAVDPDSGFNEGRTFEPNSWDAIRNWIDARQGRSNLHYSPNAPKPGVHKKPKKSDLARIRVVHVDIDAAKDEPQDPANLLILKAKLRATIDKIKADPDAPEISAIIDSGGGFNLLWFLDEGPRATPEAISEIEAQNYGMLQALGGDKGTHNIDRVLRLPGTVNLPNKTKRARGREPSLSSLVDIYPYDPPSLIDLASWVHPIAPPLTSEGLATELNVEMGAIEDCVAIGDLPADLVVRFEAARAGNPRLESLWAGESSALLGSDDSGSGYAYSLAAFLKQVGGFTPTEFGQLLRVWDYSSADKTKIGARYIERAWQNSPNPTSPAEQEFAPVPEACWVQPFKPEDIPRREFVCGRFAARQYVSALISPPGVGKTTFLLMLAVAVATGRSDIVGFTIPKRLRVYLFNQEDELDELKRRLAAVMTAFDVKWSDLVIDGQLALAIESGVDRALIFARKDGDRIIRSVDAASAEQFIKDNAIGLAIFDPFVELHPVDENNNVEIAAVGRIFRRIAVNGHCSVVLAHHTRKPANAANRESYAGDMDAGRGAGALNGVARMVATLYTVDPATAKKYGLSEAEARSYVRFDDAKANLALISGEPHFFKREGVTIGGFGGEEVGVLRPVKLSRVKNAADTTAQENASIRDAVQALLRNVGGRLSVKAVVDDLIDTRVTELESADALRKRLTRMFEKPQTYENGDRIRSENVSEKGKRGRVLQLVLDIADNAA